MYRKTLAVTLALFLLLALGGAAAAQSDDPSKKIPHHPYSDVTGNNIGWFPPAKQPDYYRLSWTTGKRWRSIKKPNTARAGNLIVPGNYDYSGNTCKEWSGRYFCIDLPDGFMPPKGGTFRVRVRAIYKGEKNGPWNGKSFTNFGIFPKS